MNAILSPSDDLLDYTIDSFWETFPPLWHQIRARIREVALQHFDITVEQFHILRHVHKGQISVSQLAAAKHISLPATSQVVDALVNKGLITRTHDTQDRRYVRLELTRAGSELLDSIFQSTHDWMRGKLALLSRPDLESIIQAFEALKNAFGAPTD